MLDAQISADQMNRRYRIFECTPFFVGGTLMTLRTRFNLYSETGTLPYAFNPGDEFVYIGLRRAGEFFVRWFERSGIKYGVLEDFKGGLQYHFHDGDYRRRCEIKLKGEV